VVGFGKVNKVRQSSDAARACQTTVQTDTHHFWLTGTTFLNEIPGAQAV
jgi:hypothetical protein